MTRFTVVAHAFHGVIYKECVLHWLENTPKPTQTLPKGQNTHKHPENTRKHPQNTHKHPQNTHKHPAKWSAALYMHLNTGRYLPTFEGAEKLCFSWWASTNIDSDLKQKWMHPMLEWGYFCAISFALRK